PIVITTVSRISMFVWLNRLMRPPPCSVRRLERMPRDPLCHALAQFDAVNHRGSIVHSAPDASLYDFVYQIIGVVEGARCARRRAGNGESESLRSKEAANGFNVRRGQEAMRRRILGVVGCCGCRSPAWIGDRRRVTVCIGGSDCGYRSPEVEVKL